MHLPIDITGTTVYPHSNSVCIVSFNMMESRARAWQTVRSGDVSRDVCVTERKRDCKGLSLPSLSTICIEKEIQAY